MSNLDSNRYLVVDDQGDEIDDDVKVQLLDEDFSQRQSAKFWGKTIGIVILVSFLASAILLVSSITLKLFDDEHGSKSDVAGELNSCYTSPSCNIQIIDGSSYDKKSGFTNATGWSNAISTSGQCCSICVPGSKSTVCFGDSPSCSQKTGNADYDYLMFDQIWLPQLCNALHSGYDPTLSHLAGTNCQYEIPMNGSLGIHGLWPNYYGGYPQCCKDTATGDYVQPLYPNEVQSWSIWNQLKEQWMDPTDFSYSSDSSSIQCNSCYMLNHEYQKHGGCFSTASEGPETYFQAGLTIAGTLSTQTAVLNNYRLSTQSLQTIFVADIEALYEPYQVNVICDPNAQGVNVFLEIQTCWNMASNNPYRFDPIDCPLASATHFTVPCSIYENVVFVS